MNSQWKCVTQHSTGAVAAVQLNDDDEIHCMGFDSKHCVYFHSMEDCNNNLSPAQAIKPLACGNHHKNVWGNTGYESPSTWCSAGRKALGNLPPSSFRAMRMSVQAHTTEVGVGAVFACLAALVAFVVMRKYKKGYTLLK
ncbi:Aste57867_2091 [Aphanomyces stellatus]|uniref:Aste57867_2091 protein n=1 Tax=Aphanomyces stellatus TaxID=120398 RepID=A0A485K9B7_9STRA|nr:hypothetical protein As57867_002086 [Aphanomyces stellatus]VFT79294.1 Aste57867_2091 [Aphanomyces stellatus]